MAIEFVQNYSDLSTDKGYQFKFYCDKCGNGYMSSFRASAIGIASSAAQVAGSLFGGIFGNVSSSSYEVQRAVGGPAHDKDAGRGQSWQMVLSSGRYHVARSTLTKLCRIGGFFAGVSAECREESIEGGVARVQALLHARAEHTVALLRGVEERRVDDPRELAETSNPTGGFRVWPFSELNVA